MKTLKNFLWHLLSEKSPLSGAVFIGVCAFLVMCFFATADIATGLFGKTLEIKDIIYQSFVAIVFGVFIKGTVTDVMGNKNLEKND